ncbi:ATP-binding cassette domain-containing protein [Candidatus Dependentiae bacterium]
MSKNNLLVGENLSYSIDERSLFQNLHISLDKEKTGLVGKNGVGKTTLIRLLTEELKPDTGTIYKNCNLGYLPQDFVVYSEKTIAQTLKIDQKLKAIERIDSGVYDQKDYEVVGDDWDILQRTKALLTKLGLGHLDLSRTMGTLSGGETTRVVLVSLLLQKPDFLILDEPTNNLDQESREALYDLISSFKGGILIVSHDRKLLSLMDQIIELTSLGAKVYGGSYDQYYSQKQVEQEAKGRALSDAQKSLKKTKKTVQTSKEKQQQRTSYGKKQRVERSHPKMFLDFQKERSQKTKTKLIQQSEKQINEAK